MPGSAVVPVSCALLLESANGTACTAGAVIGLCVAVATWLYAAGINDINGEISLASTGGEYPLLFGSILPSAHIICLWYRTSPTSGFERRQYNGAF